MTKEQQQKLDATLLNLQKKYGKGSISVFGKNQIKVERFPVSSMNLTEMMGGGFPRGRMTEIYGPESSGKTTLAEYFGGQCQNYYFEDKQRNGVVAYIDVEHSLDPVYAESIGLKMKDVIFSQPDSAEQALDIVNDLLLSGVVDLIVVDSVAALVPQAEADGEMGDQQMGLQARLMSKACRKLQANMTEKSASIIFINQIREKIGVMFGNPECVTLDTKVSIHSTKQISMENLFEKAGLDWKSMELNTAYDISDKNFTIESFNHETGKKEFKKILALVYKGESPIYEIKSKSTEKVLLTCSGGHRLWDEEMKRYTHVSELLYGSALKADGTTEEFVVEKTDRVEPIVDMSVEGNENYFSNEILSHNTTTGGNALKFYASIRFTIRRKEYVTGMNSDDVIGIVSTLKTIKNKVASPFKTCEMKLLFGKGYQVEEEYVVALTKRGLIEKSGSWYSWSYKDPSGKEGSHKEQGLDNVIKWFKDNPVLFEQFKRKIQEMLAKESNVVSEKEENEEEVIKQQTKLEKEEFADLHTSETSKPEDLAAQALAATETK